MTLNGTFWSYSQKRCPMSQIKGGSAELGGMDGCLGVLSTPLMNEPISYIISLRLSALVGHYSDTQVLASISRLKSKRKLKTVPHPKDSPTIHLINLCETYGHKTVIELYESIFVLDNTKKVV